MSRVASYALAAIWLVAGTPEVLAHASLYGGFTLDPLLWLDAALGSQQTGCPDPSSSNTRCQPENIAGGATKVLLGLRLDRQWAIETAGILRKERGGSQSAAWTRAGYASGVYTLHTGVIAVDLRGGALNWSVAVSQPGQRTRDSRWVPYTGLRLRGNNPRGLNLVLDLDWLKQARRPIEGHGNPHVWQLSFGLSSQFN